MKVLQIGKGWFPEEAGGLNRYYYDCIKYLPKAGIEVSGLVAGSSRVAQDTSGQVQAFTLAQASLLKRWRGVRRATYQLLSQADTALVVSHFALYTFPLLHQIGTRPLVTHFHGPWALESGVEGAKSLASWVKKALEQATYRRSDRFIVLSKTFRDVLYQEYRVPPERIHVIPGGTDLERFALSISRDEARSQLGWSLNRPIIFCVRRLAKRMGLENLVTAMETVRDRFPDVMLYIAGKGPLAPVLQRQIEERYLTRHVQLLGYVSDEELPVAYRAANFSVVPTVELEGFGLIVVESLAAGTPVLGTPVGGIPEILQPFCSDLVFAGASPQELAQGIMDALAGERQLPSDWECQDYVQKHYSWPAIADQIKSVYQAAMKT